MRPLLAVRSCLLALAWALAGLGLAGACGPARAQPPETEHTPPRRFGTLPTPYLLPLLRNRIVEREHLGPHNWLEREAEHNGLLYTCRAGFLDLDHVRDAADGVGHLQVALARHMAQGRQRLTVASSDRGSELRLSWQAPAGADTTEAATALASRGMWWLLTWHEVLTWLGHGAVPLVSERPSAFSYEDNVSHLVGMEAARRALARPEAWGPAMTLALDALLRELQAVPRAVTYRALDQVRDQWWSSQRAWPANSFILRRHIDLGLGHRITPWRVAGLAECEDSSPASWQLDDAVLADWQVQAELRSTLPDIWRSLALSPPTPDATPPPSGTRLRLPDDLATVLEGVRQQARHQLGPLADSPQPGTDLIDAAPPTAAGTALSRSAAPESR